MAGVVDMLCLCKIMLDPRQVPALSIEQKNIDTVARWMSIFCENRKVPVSVFESSGLVRQVILITRHFHKTMSHRSDTHK
jgi:hypothetical protein